MYYAKQKNYNKALHWTAFTLRFKAASELSRWAAPS